MQKQNSDKGVIEYDIDKFSIILPEVQTGNIGKRQPTECNGYQRASR